MTDATKATLLLSALTLALLASIGVAVHKARGRAAAIEEAIILKGEIRAARQAEETAKADRAAARQLVTETNAEVARLQRQAAQHPVPPPAVPVPADASAAVVVAGLQGLGLHPRELGTDLALTLPDGRAVLGWGREALRVPGLQARLGDLEQLTTAQEARSQAQTQQQAATDRALAAADTRAEAEARRAAALARAIDLTPRTRTWAVGALYGVDTTGQRYLGAYASASWGPAQVQVLYLNHTAALGGGIRF